MPSTRDCKIVLLGQESTGKSSLLERLLHDKFDEGRCIATVGASYGAKRMQTKHGEVVVSVWDTAGAERFDSLSRLYYSGAEAALICVDLTSSISFAKSQHWVKELQQHQPQCRVYIVLTKCDLLPETPSQLPAQVSEAVPPQPELSNDRVGSTGAHIAPPPAPVQLLEEADRFDYDSKGMAFNRMKASPTNVLDRTSSSYGSSTSRSQNEGTYFAPERSTRRKEVGDSQLQSVASKVHAKLAYTSASTGQGIQELFQMVAEDLAEKPIQEAAQEMPQKVEEELVQKTPSVEERKLVINDPVRLDTPSCVRATREACCR